MTVICTQSPGTDPMAYGGINKWMPSPKSGGIPRVSTRFSLSGENEWTDEPVSRDQILTSRANGNRVNIIILVQLTTSRIGNHTRLIHTLLKVLTIQSQKTRFLSYFALNGKTLDIWPLLQIPKNMGTTQYLNFAQFHLKLCDINHIIRTSFQINGLNDL